MMAATRTDLGEAVFWAGLGKSVDGVLDCEGVRSALPMGEARALPNL